MRPGSRRGFTLIELMVVLAVLALLSGIVAPRYLDRVDQARETALRENLRGLRVAVDQFYRDKGRYPANLEELVSHRYIRFVPADPITRQESTWVTVPPHSGESSVFDVRSGSKERARDGSRYAEW